MTFVSLCPIHSVLNTATRVIFGGRNRPSSTTSTCITDAMRDDLYS